MSFVFSNVNKNVFTPFEICTDLVVGKVISVELRWLCLLIKLWRSAPLLSSLVLFACSSICLVSICDFDDRGGTHGPSAAVCEPGVEHVVIIGGCSPRQGTVFRIRGVGPWLHIGCWFSTVNKNLENYRNRYPTWKMSCDRAAVGDGGWWRRRRRTSLRGTGGPGSDRRVRSRSSLRWPRAEHASFFPFYEYSHGNRGLIFLRIGPISSADSCETNRG